MAVRWIHVCPACATKNQTDSTGQGGAVLMFRCDTCNTEYLIEPVYKIMVPVLEVRSAPVIDVAEQLADFDKATQDGTIGQVKPPKQPKTPKP